MQADRTGVPGCDVSVAIVSLNTRALLQECLRSVFASAGVTYEVFVVDNGSTDGSPEMVATAFPAVRLICNRENRGFAAASNLAVAQASGRHLLLLNPDTVVQPDTFREMTAFLDEHPGAAICGVPTEVSRAMMRGWYAQNGVSLQNPRLGFVCTAQTVDGQHGLAGYFLECDRELGPDERLRFRPGELPPPFDPDAAPRLPDGQWPAARLAKANRNYAMEYVRSGLPRFLRRPRILHPQGFRWVTRPCSR